MGHTAADQSIENPGVLKGTTTTTVIFTVCVIIGIIAFFSNYFVDPMRSWASLLAGHFYFLSITMGAMFFMAIQWITTSMWSASVRRIAESFTAYLPIVLISSLALFLGARVLYPWTHADIVNGDIVLEGKKGYLSMNFFMIRGLVSVFAWWFFAKILVGSSLGVDKGANSTAAYHSNRKTSIAFLIIFSITFSMTAIDQLMSLDPHFFSTMFPVYIFAGSYQSFFAMLAIVAIILKRSGYLSKVVNENHIHDIAKLMFAFTVFWAYTGFSQYMLIWYANLPEETAFFMLRTNQAWEPVSIALFMGRFTFPFLALLPRGNKRSEALVFCVSIWILAMHFLDLNWLIQPETGPAGLRVGFTEVGVWLGFFGFFGLIVKNFMMKNNVLAHKDPYLADSVFHHHV